MDGASVFGAGMGAFALLWICFAGVGIGLTVFWIWALVDCLTKEPEQGNTKLLWAFILLATHGLGAILYFAIRRPARIREIGR